MEKSIGPWLSELFPTPKGIPLEFSFLFFSLLGNRKKGLDGIVWALVLLRTYTCLVGPGIAHFGYL